MLLGRGVDDVGDVGPFVQSEVKGGGWPRVSGALNEAGAEALSGLVGDEFGEAFGKPAFVVDVGPEVGQLVEGGDVVGDGGDGDVAGGHVAGGTTFVAQRYLAAALGDVDGRRAWLREAVELFQEGERGCDQLLEVLAPGIFALEVGEGHIDAAQGGRY